MCCFSVRPLPLVYFDAKKSTLVHIKTTIMYGKCSIWWLSSTMATAFLTSRACLLPGWSQPLVCCQAGHSLLSVARLVTASCLLPGWSQPLVCCQAGHSLLSVARLVILIVHLCTSLSRPLFLPLRGCLSAHTPVRISPSPLLPSVKLPLTLQPLSPNPPSSTAHPHCTSRSYLTARP